MLDPATAPMRLLAKKLREKALVQTYPRTEATRAAADAKEEVYREIAEAIEECFGKDEEQVECPGVG